MGRHPLGLRGTLPAPVHAARAVAGIASAVGQADAQVGAGVHDAAHHQRGEGQRAVGQVPHRVGQVVALDAGVHDGVARLVKQDDRAQLLGGLPEGHELRLVQQLAVDLVVDHRALEPQVHHYPLQLGDGGGHVLHGQRGQSREPVGPGLHHLADLVVALPGRRNGHVSIHVVVVEAAEGRDHVHVHAQGVHVGQALLRRPAGLGRKLPPRASRHQDGASVGVLFPPQGVPVAAALGGAPETLRRQVGVNVDAAHVRLLLGDYR